MAIQRILLIVLDSLGVGAMPDATDFGDGGSHTLKHIVEATDPFRLPALESLGLGQLDSIPKLSGRSVYGSAYGKMAEKSAAKDTTTGHWEMMGVISHDPPQIFPHGFPQKLIQAFEQAIGRKILCNRPASGTEIIAELGEEHLKTGRPIVYTSADSVFQIACHEEVIPISQLYEYCEIARALCDEYQVGRVIARPFTGAPGGFVRTKRRRDYAMLPPEKTVLEYLQDAHVPVIGIGKIRDIFSGKGIDRSYHTQSNPEGIDQTFHCLKEEKEGLIFVNLVDFDMLYGHRRDPQGYADALVEFDHSLKQILEKIGTKDLLMITADHGCDPTFTKTTDHTREYVPILVFSPAIQGTVSLGTRTSFCDIGATLAEIFQVDSPHGKSFLPEIKK